MASYRCAHESYETHETYVPHTPHFSKSITRTKDPKLGKPS
jgi:hypothetical protein